MTTTPDVSLEEGLRELALPRMASIVKERLKRAATETWTHRRLLRDLITEEQAHRREKALASRLRRSQIPEHWSLSTFPFEQQPAVRRAQIEELAELDWVRQATNIVLIGNPGSGKTGLASSLLRQALLDGYTGQMYRTQDMLDDLHRSIADRRTKHMLNRLSRLDVLLADEVGYLNLNNEQINLFFKLMDNRYKSGRPTLVTTNLGYDEWGTFLKNPAMVKALLSRLRHRCVTIVIDGPDLRAPAAP